MSGVITILHGDDLVKISDQITLFLTEAKNKGQHIFRFEASQLNLPDLGNALSAQELFESARLIVIDGLHSLPVSKKRSGFISQIAQLESDPLPIILVENKLLTPTQLKVFGKAKVITCKTAKTVFAWLDSLGQNNKASQLTALNQALHDSSPEQVFYLLIRHVRLLLLISDGGADRISPQELPAFAKSKMTTQARLWGWEKLAKLYQQLLDIDLNQKTGKAMLSLEQSLQQLVLVG